MGGGSEGGKEGVREGGREEGRGREGGREEGREGQEEGKEMQETRGQVFVNVHVRNTAKHHILTTVPAADHTPTVHTIPYL